MSYLIIGSKGSMGKRYEAIFKYLKEPVVGVDKEISIKAIVDLAKDSDGIILATPTDTHYAFLMKLLPLGVSILCEKPITRDLQELSKILEVANKCKTPLTMVNQYRELVSEADMSHGLTEYDYFRTGSDGLAWDCLNIVGLAKDQINLKNKSPIWRCKINGTSLKISDMDFAYVSMIRKWLKGQLRQAHEYIYTAHQKAERLSHAYANRN